MAYTAIETVLWTGIKGDVGADAVFGGIYADKPGYHNSRNRLRARGMYDDYSIQAELDKVGPGDLGSALDVTFRSAQAGSFSNIAKYSQRLLQAGLNKDPRMYPVREFFGNTDNDNEVEGWSYYRGRAVSSDRSHLWHIHLSIHRKYINDPAAMRSVLEVWTGKEKVEGDMDLTPQNLKDIAEAVWNRDGIPNWTPAAGSNANMQSDNALYELGRQLNAVQAQLDALSTKLG